MSDAVSHNRDDSAAWGTPAEGNPRWPALLAVLVAIALQAVVVSGPVTILR